MDRILTFIAALAILIPSYCQAEGNVSVRPSAILTEIIEHMPKGEKQEIRVLTASIEPGARTVFHTHPFPVTLFILEGSFTLEVEGRSPITIKAGQAMVEPTDVKMTGFNRSSTETMRAVLFYVSDPDAPFLHLITP